MPYRTERSAMACMRSRVLDVPVVDFIVAERQQNGDYKTIEDFLKRVSGKEVNKRAVENLIKAGAMDGLDGNRHQMITVFPPSWIRISSDKKSSMAGQMTLFDIASDDIKEEFEIKMPDLEEYDKEEFLALEKEVLGVYISGHPLEKYTELLKKNVTAGCRDFMLDEETHKVTVADGAMVIIGGMITDKTIKYTRNNQTMAFITIEDLLGSVEVIVFAREYEKYRNLLEVDNKILIKGRAQAEEEKNAKLICTEMHGFDEVRKELWIQFATKEEFEAKQQTLFDAIADMDGEDNIVVYISAIKAMKRMPANWNISVNEDAMEKISQILADKM